MAKGDHLTVSFGVYQHHAIDMGDGRVIQYGGGDLSMHDNKVEIVDYETLAAKGEVFVVEEAASFSPDEIIERALSRIGEKNYSLRDNNCEHFVNWCRTGQSESRQVDRTIERIASCAAKIASKSSAKFVSQRLASTAGKQLVNLPTRLFLLADAAQLGAEIAASHRGADAKTSETIGKATGFSASVGIGLAAAGPAGAIAGAGLWGLGEIAGRKIIEATQPNE